jgi:hypothetical protein
VRRCNGNLRGLQHLVEPVRRERRSPREDDRIDDKSDEEPSGSPTRRARVNGRR